MGVGEGAPNLHTARLLDVDGRAPCAHGDLESPGERGLESDPDPRGPEELQPGPASGSELQTPPVRWARVSSLDLPNPAATPSAAPLRGAALFPGQRHQGGQASGMGRGWASPARRGRGSSSTGAPAHRALPRGRFQPLPVPAARPGLPEPRPARRAPPGAAARPRPAQALPTALCPFSLAVCFPDASHPDVGS